MYHCIEYESPLGRIVIAADEDAVAGLWFQGQKYFGGSIIDELQFGDETDILRDARLWLDRYFKGEKVSPGELPLRPSGNEFRQKVWQILCEIPYGKVLAYGEIAKLLERKDGKKMSSQAVGGAVGHNPISLIIPCHRVIGRDGSLTGYAGGVERKQKLLLLEGADMDHLYIPKKGTAL